MAKRKKAKGRKSIKRGRKKGAARSSTAKRGAAKRTTLKAGMVVARKPTKAALKKAKMKATKVGKLATAAKKGKTVFKLAGKKRSAKRSKRK
jgi:hypothetical protein